MAATEADAAVKVEALRIGQESYMSKLKQVQDTAMQDLRQRHATETADLEIKHKTALDNAKMDFDSMSEDSLHRQDAAMDFCVKQVRNEAAREIASLKAKAQRSEQDMGIARDRPHAIATSASNDSVVARQPSTSGKSSTHQLNVRLHGNALVPVCSSEISARGWRALRDMHTNLDKLRCSSFFTKPVDPVSLNIPLYFTVIKQPMDLGTMKQKLRGGSYRTLQQYVNDFDLIVKNTQIFNGDANAVTHAALAMKAYFERAMEGVIDREQKAASLMPGLKRKAAEDVDGETLIQKRTMLQVHGLPVV